MFSRLNHLTFMILNARISHLGAGMLDSNAHVICLLVVRVFYTRVTVQSLLRHDVISF